MATRLLPGRQFRSFFFRHQASTNFLPSGSFPRGHASAVECLKLVFSLIEPSQWSGHYAVVSYRFLGMGRCHPECSYKSYCTSAEEGSSSDDLLDPGREESDGGAGSDESSKRSMNSKEKNDLIMMFTCKVCDPRSAKTMTRDTYDNGIVIVRCPRCQKLYLIADRLRWFGEPGSVEDFLAQQGVDVRKGSEFSADDLQGGRQKSRMMFICNCFLWEPNNDHPQELAHIFCSLRWVYTLRFLTCCIHFLGLQGC